MESRTRSLVKALSWQFLGLFTMSAIGYAFTGSLSSGGALALASAGVSFFTYLMHERAWAAVTWGKLTGRDPVDPRASRSEGDAAAA
ncbi:MAG: DUF2061 domain-containing protein [Rhizobiaceae bacterium]|nr:DUF2061 domain-containing protein [Rhizobiaceae bacterium]